MTARVTLIVVMGAMVFVDVAAQQVQPAPQPVFRSRTDLVQVDAVVSDGVEYAKGNRFAHARVQDMPLARRSAGRVLAALTRLATGLAVQDTQCGYTALAAGTARNLPWSELWPRYGYPNDLLGMLFERGLPVREVVVRPVYGDEVSGIGLRHALLVIPWVLTRVLTRRITAALSPLPAELEAE